MRLGGRTGWLSVRKDPKRPALLAEVSLSLAGVNGAAHPPIAGTSVTPSSMAATAAR